MKYDYKGRPICPQCNRNITYMEMCTIKGCTCGYRLSMQELNKQPLKSFKKNYMPKKIEKLYNLKDIRLMLIMCLEEANDHVISDCKCSDFGTDCYIDIDYSIIIESVLYEYEKNDT